MVEEGFFLYISVAAGHESSAALEDVEGPFAGRAA